MEEPKEFKGDKIIVDVGVFSDANKENIKVEHEMEDFLKAHPEYQGDKLQALFTIFDGHSGTEVAQECLEKFPTVFAKSLEEKKNDISEAFKQTYLTLDEGFKQWEDRGSTGIVIYVCLEDKKRVFYSSNVGDSRAALVKKDEAIRCSYDHKATDKPEIKRAKEIGGLFFKHRLGGVLAITRSLGDFTFKCDIGGGLIAEPTTNKFTVEPDDKFLVLASDGLWDMINEEKLYNLVKESPNLNAQEMAQFLVKSSKELGSRDNISCIVVKLN